MSDDKENNNDKTYLKAGRVKVSSSVAKEKLAEKLRQNLKRRKKLIIKH